MVGVKATFGSGGGGHDFPGGQRGVGEQPPAARTPAISAATRLARRAGPTARHRPLQLQLTLLGRTAPVPGCSEQQRELPPIAALPSPLVAYRKACLPYVLARIRVDHPGQGGV